MNARVTSGQQPLPLVDIRNVHIDPALPQQERIRSFIELRFVQQTMVTGQAAGVAAALCVKHSKTPRELETDVSELQKILLEQGASLSLPDDEKQFTL